MGGYPLSDPAPLLIGVVCEGKTDFVVLSALLRQVLGSEMAATMVHPEVSAYAGGGFGRLGGGWKGVRAWCLKRVVLQQGLRRAMQQAPLSAYSLLVIHVDADVAADPEVSCERPCPPASGTVDALRAFVLREWCSGSELPPRVVFCIPSKSTEAWVLVALYPDDRLATPDIECRSEPETLLKQRPEKLVSGPESRKSTAAYRAVAPRVAEAWPHVCSVCSQAERFDRELRAALVFPT